MHHWLAERFVVITLVPISTGKAGDIKQSSYPRTGTEVVRRKILGFNNKSG